MTTSALSTSVAAHNSRSLKVAMWVAANAKESLDMQNRQAYLVV